MVTTLCGVMDRNVGPTSVVGAMDTETWIFGANQHSGFVFFFGTKWATLTPAQECLLLTFRDDFSTLQVAAEKYWTLDGFTVLRFTCTFATGEGETDTAFKNRPWKNCFFLSEEYSLQVGELNGRTRMQEALSVYSGCHSRMKEKKQQRLSQRHSFWCETWPEEFLLSGKLAMT